MQSFLNLRSTLVFVSILTAWRLYLSATLQLHPDEAYYWLWSRHLDIAYFDHSPLVAYFIWVTTFISKSEFWVRLSGTFVILATSYLTWQISMRMFNNVSVAAGSVMLFNATPLSMLGLIVITPDIPVYLFWALCIYLFWRIVESKQSRQWYALGFAFGLALLSKYTALLLLPSLLVYLVFSDDRRWLKNHHPWLAMLLGLLCFVPVIMWNSRHDWVSFLFQYRHGLESDSLVMGRASVFFTSQMLLVGPLLWLAGMYAAFKAIFVQNKAMRLLSAAALPAILFFGIISINKLAGPNWTAFAYFSFIILFTKYFLGSPSKLKRITWHAAMLSTLSIGLLITLHARFSILPLAIYSRELAIADATNMFYGWRELGQDLKHIPGMREAITPSHQLGAEVSYYTDGKLLVRTDASARPSQFNIWKQTAVPPAKRGSYVWSNSDDPSRHERFFPDHENIHTFTIRRKNIAVRRFSIVP